MPLCASPVGASISKHDGDGSATPPRASSAPLRHERLELRDRRAHAAKRFARLLGIAEIAVVVELIGGEHDLLDARFDARPDWRRAASPESRAPDPWPAAPEHKCRRADRSSAAIRLRPLALSNRSISELGALQVQRVQRVQRVRRVQWVRRVRSACVSAAVGMSREYAGNAKSKRLSLSSELNEIFAVNFSRQRQSARCALRRRRRSAPAPAASTRARASCRFSDRTLPW